MWQNNCFDHQLLLICNNKEAKIKHKFGTVKLRRALFSRFTEASSHVQVQAALIYTCIRRDDLTENFLPHTVDSIIPE